jgi:hypothetical protein
MKKGRSRGFLLQTAVHQKMYFTIWILPGEILRFFKVCIRAQNETLVEGGLSNSGKWRFRDTVVSSVSRVVRGKGLVFVEFSI